MDISLPNVPFPPHLTTQQIRGYSENDLDSYGAQLQLDWGLGESHHLITGLDWILDDMSATDDQTMTMTSTFPPLNTGTTRTVYDYEGTQESVAAFAQDEWSLAPDWALTLGSRWTWVETKLQDTDDPALVEDSERHSESVFALGLVNTSLDDWAFRGHVSQGFRVANLQQLYIGTIHGDRIPTFPNPDLDPETSQNAELGARYSGERLALDTAVFYSEADDYITAQMTGPATRQYVNISESTAFGAELSLACNLNPGQDLDIEPYIQGTWLRRRFDDGATSTYDSGRPLLSGRFGVRSTWRASADATAWADLYMRAADEADDANANTSTPGWSTLNLALGLTLGPNPETDTGTSAVRWRFVAGVENIGDRKYASAADREFTADMEAVPAPGRNVFVKVGCDF
jgi:hemoglobin/transferrin/lactoferrin receptor protein